MSIIRATYDLYSSAVSVSYNADTDTLEALDSSGNAITLNRSSIDTKAALEELRDERNQRLSATDWWASSDLTMTTAQTNYRQALRDITNTYTSLDDVVWPTKP